MSNTLTRAAIANSIYNETGFPVTDGIKVIDVFLDEISVALENDDMVKLSSFGSFFTNKKKARIGRNPKTGIEVEISSRKVVSFSISNLLKEKINLNLGGYVRKT